MQNQKNIILKFHFWEFSKQWVRERTIENCFLNPIFGIFQWSGSKDMQNQKILFGNFRAVGRRTCKRKYFILNYIFGIFQSGGQKIKCFHPGDLLWRQVRRPTNENSLPLVTTLSSLIHGGETEPNNFNIFQRFFHDLARKEKKKWKIQNINCQRKYFSAGEIYMDPTLESSIGTSWFTRWTTSSAIPSRRSLIISRITSWPGAVHNMDSLGDGVECTIITLKNCVEYKVKQTALWANNNERKNVFWLRKMATMHMLIKTWCKNLNENGQTTSQTESKHPFHHHTFGY